MDEQKIDLTVLDPSRDPERWERLVQSVVSRASAARRRTLTVGRQLVAWARPALAIAAGLALLSWAGRLASPEPEAAVARARDDPASVLVRWASSDERPPAARILEVLGERDGAEKL